MVMEACLRAKDYGQVKAYLLADSAEPHLVFQEETAEHPLRLNGYEYHISPFYTVTQRCQWLSPRILSSIISATLVDPLEVREEIMKFLNKR